jgi:acid phosphatase
MSHRLAGLDVRSFVRSALNICVGRIGQRRRAIALGAVAAGMWVASPLAWSADTAHPLRASHHATKTPIENLIVIVGENQTFDGLFATYVPKPGASVRNLLTEGIVDGDGNAGPRFVLAAQRKAVPQAVYMLDPPRTTAYATLPSPRLIGVQDQKFHDVANGVDARFPSSLPNGPFQITRYVPYPKENAAPTLETSTAALSAATGDPVHRFFQMWQQTGGDNTNPDLYVWVAATAGMGADTTGITAADPGQGGELMGFVNMHRGDASYLRTLADRYAISDNHHQFVMGGTGVNFFSIATGDVPVYKIGGTVVTPPANQVENPNPAPGSENFFSQDGYQGGSFVNCSDAQQPGVGAILGVLQKKGIASHCEPGAYYLVNNYSAGYDLDGHPQPLGPHNYNYPPQTVPTIAESLSKAGVSWSWYTGARDVADVRTEMKTLHLSLDAARRLQYNDIGDPLVASTAVMTQPALKSGLKGLTSFDRDVARGALPAVSFLVPKNLDSGHPGYSVEASYEDFVRDVIAKVQAHPKLWAHTAILVTTDEGGGHFDSGFIQILDFFGDGPRIPLIVVSPYAKRGHVDHGYSDHASILKFIEYNWGLPKLSNRSRDNLPNPVATAEDPYRPTNGPAVGDLLTLFAF